MTKHVATTVQTKTVLQIDPIIDGMNSFIFCDLEDVEVDSEKCTQIGIICHYGFTFCKMLVGESHVSRSMRTKPAENQRERNSSAN